ncbi:CDP-diacylglycerol diphosphatase [Mycobacterium decipiens]|uniref:CDP-diacylglycerol diphosphatase n=1 Tax=Mycobacterium decipiens TaxID=1430326 RepID=A0A1X2LU17_9MYCO|nr:CDP-diacylglycerol diphosphatase [Mycobacterium decipiens]OSC40433.1 hypothetical protein B8W66_12980 [Mycobacterium decipiens]
MSDKRANQPDPDDYELRSPTTIDHRSTDRGVIRGRFAIAYRGVSTLLACCAVVAGGVLAVGASPQAAANPMLPPQPGNPRGPATAVWPLPACGSPQDDDPLWKLVEDVTPQQPGTNVKVVFPSNDRTMGYAIHRESSVNFLLMPAIRELGIECPNLLDPAAPQYFLDAFNELGLLAGYDWALGINSVKGRTQNQLHIHLATLQEAARNDIDDAVTNGQVPTDQSSWASAVISVMCRGFRAWNPASFPESWGSNLFAALDNEIVTPSNGDMGNEVLLVTANHVGSGYIVLNSDEVSRLNPSGVDYVDLLLNI